MESFEIEYKGQKLTVRKSKNGECYIQLPTRFGRNNTVFIESINKSENEWIFSSSIEGDPEYFFTASLRDDGTMSYVNDLMNSRKICDEKFDPNDFQSGGTLHDVFQSIYDVKKQVEELEKMGMTANEIGALRRKKVETVLKMLGYHGDRDIENTSYLALGRIGKQLEDYQNLAAYVYRVGIVDGTEKFDFSLPSDMSSEELKKMVTVFQTELAEDISFIETQDEERSVQSSILDDFCVNMSKKVPDNDWILYSSVVRKTAELFIELNADLLLPEMRQKITDSTSLTGRDLQDRLSELIDSREFSKACNIEDRFVMRESQRFSDKIDTLIDDSEMVKKSSVGTRLEALKREAISTRDRRQKFSDRYNEMQNYLTRKTPFKESFEEREDIDQND